MIVRSGFVIIIWHPPPPSTTTHFVLPWAFPRHIHTPSYLSEPPPAEMEMNTSQKKISELSDDGSEHPEATMGDGVQDDIDQDI